MAEHHSPMGRNPSLVEAGLAKPFFEGNSCFGCEEEAPENECKESKNPCGHHCNCFDFWPTTNQCCWCGKIMENCTNCDEVYARDPEESSWTCANCGEKVE